MIKRRRNTCVYVAAGLRPPPNLLRGNSTAANSPANMPSSARHTHPNSNICLWAKFRAAMLRYSVVIHDRK